MSFLATIGAKLVGGGIVKTAEGVATAIDRFVETKEEKKAAERLLIKIQQEPDRWQAEINKVEAAHRNLFVAGWRPAVGWVCVIALVWGWIVMPTAVFVIKLLQSQGILGPIPELPAIAVGQAISLVMALLGVAGIRTYEKKHGLTS